MKNKYDIMSVRPTYATDPDVGKVYSGEEEYVRFTIVADAVVNNEGYLTFMNMEMPAADAVTTSGPKASLVQIIAKGEWTRVVNTGPFIEEVK